MKAKFEHGGALALNSRKSRRPLNTKMPVHLVLRSDLAKDHRSLLKYKRLVLRILNRYAKKFQVRIYECAVCSNHLHCLVKAPSRQQLQNFFRVFSGQVAQEILRLFPLQKNEARAFRGGTHPKNQKSFWSLLAHTRLVSWGRDFLNVKSYVIQNTLEALGLIPYQKRPSRRLVFKTKK